MISHFHKTVFVHIPKCGGMSVEQAFLADIGLDWDHRAPLLLIRNKQSRTGPERLAHLTAAEYLTHKYCTPDHFRAYYKFALVRDPISRLVSVYNYIYLKRYSKPFRAAYMAFEAITKRPYPFDRFVSELIEPAINDPLQQDFGAEAFYKGFYWFIRPQVDFLFDDSGLLVDDVFRLEALSEAWPKITKESGVEAPLVHVNSSTKRLSVHDLSASQRDHIRELYASDYAFLEGLAN